MINRVIFYILIIINLVIFNFSCVSSTNDKSKQDNNQKTSCNDFRQVNECLENHCIYVIDSCRERYLKNEIIPGDLGKIKKVAAEGDSICVLDMNDQIWCFSKYAHTLELYPHRNLKYTNIQWSIDTFCAIDKDGKGQCFPNKKVVTASKAFKRIAYSQIGSSDSEYASCAIDIDDGLHCISSNGIFDKLPSYITSLGWSAKPKEIFMGFSDIIYILFNDEKFVQFICENTGIRHGVAATDVVQYSSSINGYCYLKADEKIECKNRSGIQEILPAHITNTEFVEVSAGLQHFCAIKKGNREMICSAVFGSNSKVLLDPIPSNLTGVKHVSVSGTVTCIINSEDALACFYAKDN